MTPDIADSLGVKTASGALVAKQNKDAPAAQAGVKIGDVITAVNGEPVADPRELARRIAALGPKKTAELTIWRDGASRRSGDARRDAERPAGDERPGDRQPDAGQASVAKLGLTLESGQDGVTSPTSIPTAPPPITACSRAT